MLRKNNSLIGICLLQKRAIRVIHRSSYLAHATPLFLSSRILKLEDVYTYNLAMYMFDRRLEPEFRIDHSHNTRNHSNQVLPPYERLTLTQHSVKYSACKIWNQLPESLKNIESKCSFGRNLKNFLFDKYSSDNN